MESKMEKYKDTLEMIRDILNELKQPSAVDETCVNLINLVLKEGSPNDVD